MHDDHSHVMEGMLLYYCKKVAGRAFGRLLCWRLDSAMIRFDLIRKLMQYCILRLFELLVEITTSFESVKIRVVALPNPPVRVSLHWRVLSLCFRHAPKRNLTYITNLLVR